MKRASVFITLLLVALFTALMGVAPASADIYSSIWGFVWGDSDFDVDIADSLVPSGGITGQVLTRSASGLEWGTVPTTSQFNALSSNYNRLDSRVGKLEETQWIIGLGARISDTESGTLSAFADYSVNRSKFDRVGVRYEFKLGPSSEDRKIVKAIQRIQELEQENAILREEGTKKDERISSLEERVSALERAWLERN